LQCHAQSTFGPVASSHHLARLPEGGRVPEENGRFWRNRTQAQVFASKVKITIMNSKKHTIQVFLQLKMNIKYNTAGAA
jgi:hypothetical protein